ncbi:hypothetical protein [Flavobacterium sp. J27]|uniref:hypothetical protein n=1 Tax=Flavobacterium sp. J27 TaxID=2060419 RepID=UPI00103150E0|nr:hypothetical protein [Flavobacterium sp. J27]
MGAPHNKNRYGELWNQNRIDESLKILHLLKEYIVLSGGWAWHFMSIPNHIEYKHAHDHKDIDIFVHPKNVAKVMEVLLENSFEKVWTRYDHLYSAENFRRYEKIIAIGNEKAFRITIDFFERTDLQTEICNGFTVVSPEMLLRFYSNIHSSDKCWAVIKAKEFLEKGINPIGRKELSEIPK